MGFSLAIYESSWDKLIANKKNKLFRQCISTQFNKSTLNKKIPSNMSKDKQANVFRISLLILPRLSKSVLEKLKFFKKNTIVDLVNKSGN